MPLSHTSSIIIIDSTLSCSTVLACHRFLMIQNQCFFSLEDSSACLMDVHSINFVPVWLFLFVTGSFQAVHTKSLSNSILCESCEMPECCCPKHTFTPCWIAVQYVARVLQFSASSFSFNSVCSTSRIDQVTQVT